MAGEWTNRNPHPHNVTQQAGVSPPANSKRDKMKAKINNLTPGQTDLLNALLQDGTQTFTLQQLADLTGLVEALVAQIEQRQLAVDACNALVESTIQGHPDPKAKLTEAIMTARAALADPREQRQRARSPRGAI